jgi:hypothetical protein
MAPNPASTDHEARSKKRSYSEFDEDDTADHEDFAQIYSQPWKQSVGGRAHTTSHPSELKYLQSHNTQEGTALGASSMKTPPNMARPAVQHATAPSPWRQHVPAGYDPTLLAPHPEFASAEECWDYLQRTPEHEDYD